MTRLLVAVAVTWLGSAGLAEQDGAGPFDSAVRLADVDFEASRAFRNETPVPASRDEIAAALGLPGKSKGWSAGSVSKHGVAESFRYLLVLKQPVALGSVVCPKGWDVRMLKAGSPCPPNTQNEADWVKADVPRGQGGFQVVPLPPGSSTRALLLSERRSQGKSELALCRLFARRLYNIVPLAVANAESEYTTIPFLSAPHTFRASDIVKGSGAWVNDGKDRMGLIRRAPISEVAPSWFALSWETPQTLVGLWCDDNVVQAEYYVFTGPEGINPAVGTAREWKRLRPASQADSGGRWVSFEPVKTRGLKMLILRTRDGQIARIDAMHVFSDLGTGPLPAATQAVPQPTFPIPYTLEEEGEVTVVVNDSAGVRVRNLMARRQRPKGGNMEYWDLKNEAGDFVLPGDFQWKLITHPPLGLRYEMTAYPNVTANTPENSPWLNGHAGPGGWLADHTPPRAVCTSGDRVYLGSAVAESGVSFIECDLTGRKLWGYHSFAEWTGPDFLAADEDTVFVGSSRDGIDRVWTVDIATKAVGSFLSLPATSQRQRGLQDMAARGGKLYLSVQGHEDCFGSAMSHEDIDVLNCLPRYNEARPPRFPHEVPPDPRDDFLRLFRLKNTPPGNGPEYANLGLIWLETTRGPESRQHVVLACKKPCPVGSVACPLPELGEDVHLRLSVLKPDAPYPPDPSAESHWVTFFTDKDARPGWHVIPAPENAMTRALRITFSRGEDAFTELVEDAEAKEGPKGKREDGAMAALKEDLNAQPGEGGDADNAWKGRIEGMKVLRRRFTSLLPPATVRVNSGVVNADGSWDAKRAKPLSPEDPGIYLLEWTEPQTVRGLAIKEVDGKTTEIDVATGDAVNLDGGDGWQRVATYEQPLRYTYVPDKYNNFDARYVDGYVDFGREVTTRAIRLRVVAQWISRAADRAGCVGVRRDLGGSTIDPGRCRVYGVAAVRSLGGEPPVDPRTAERIEVVDKATRKIEREIPIRKPGSIALNPAGELHALSGNKVVKVDLTASDRPEHQVFIDDLKYPRGLAFDSAGRAYVFDYGAKGDQVIRIYGPDGRYERSTGTPGGYRVGPWDGTRMKVVSAIEVDKEGQLWVVENHMWPKRVSLWSTADGALKKEFLGPTSYGGGGYLNPWNKKQLFYGNLEFELDWEKGTTRLKNLTWPDGGDAGDVPIRIQDRTYLVNTKVSAGAETPCGIVYLYERDHLRRVAAMGIANAFAPLQDPRLFTALGSKVLTDHEFLWSDRSGDGEVQADEVEMWPRRQGSGAVSLFDRTLGTQSGRLRYEVKEFLPNGVPVYEKRMLTGIQDRPTLRLDDGNFYQMEDTRKKWDPALVRTPDGKVLWSYKAGCTLEDSDPMFPEQIVSQFGWVGHETAHAGGLGEFLVVSSNVATWNIWTSDGLLAGQIFRDLRDYRARGWSMREHERGLRIDDVSPGQEHFQGYFCRTFEDNRYYVVAGHNHASVVEVLGIDRFRRLGGVLTVTPEDLRKAQEWDRDMEKKKGYERALVADCFRVKESIRIDGDTGDWASVAAEMGEQARFRMAYDDRSLYLCYEVRDMGPLKNSGNQWDMLFKTGASVDFQMGTDPNAPPGRRAPVKGDFRLLMTCMGDRPTACLYRPVVPGTPEDKRWHVVSPVLHVTFDEVVRLGSVRMAVRTDDRGYRLEASVPLADIGLQPRPNLRLKMDWGILVTGPDGNEVLRRVYWANQSTHILADAPSEALLHPGLWGTVRFHGAERSEFEQLKDSLELQKGSGEEEGEDDLQDDADAGID